MQPSLSCRARVATASPISELMARAIGNPRLISLAAGFVDPLTLPTTETEQAVHGLMHALTEARQALQYGTTLGYSPLRDAILQRFLSEGIQGAIPPTLDRVMLTAGSNQLLQLVAECLFDPGDIVLCAAPTYFVFLGLLKNLGVRAIGVECDQEGISPPALEATLDALARRRELARVKAIYLVSYCDNPRGLTMPTTRREDVMRICVGTSHRPPIYVIEDMAYRPLHLGQEVPPSLFSFDPTGDHTIVAGTFSKSFSPGLRVGWGILPPQLVAPVANLKGNIDFGSPNLNQHLMHRVLQLGCFESHVERLRATYGRKLQATLDALEASLAGQPGVRWIHPDGGLYVWLELPEGLGTGPDQALFRAAVERGVLYVPGEYCFPDEGVARQANTIRLSFGAPEIAAIEAGIAALGDAISSVMSNRG